MTSFLLFIFFQSCNIKSKEDKFVDKYQLNSYADIYLVSSISCGGCIGNYFEKIDTQNYIIIYDSSSHSEFIKKLDKFNHLNLFQSELDTYFNEFGGVIKISKINGTYHSFKIKD